MLGYYEKNVCIKSHLAWNFISINIRKQQQQQNENKTNTTRTQICILADSNNTAGTTTTLTAVRWSIEISFHQSGVQLSAGGVPDNAQPLFKYTVTYIEFPRI